MWQNYLTVGLRSLAKNRLYTFINIFGLAIGLAACLMILLYVRYEVSYDSWLPGAQNVYQLESWFLGKTTGHPQQLQVTSYIAGERFKKDFPEVEKEIYALSGTPVFLKDGQALPTKDFIYADGNLLDVIPLPLVRGTRNGLDAVDTAMMTQTEARNRFGTDDVVGKTFTIIAKGEHRVYRITGVLRDIPKNSHLKITTVAHANFRQLMIKEPQFLSCWGCQGGWVYLKLRPGSDVAAMAARLPAWKKRNIPDENSGALKFNQGDDQDWHLVNVRDVHTGKAQIGTMTPGNDRGSIVTFAVVALLILGMAIVNFTNLSTSRASQRAREVALRKVLGASRQQLIGQFIGESLLITAMAMLVAVALAELLMPPFAAFLDADLKLNYFGAGGIALPVIVLLVVVGVLGGIYPAFFLSRFQPAAVLKANRSSAETPGSGRLRSALVIAQFAVSIGLIICTTVIYAQTIYARSVDPGFSRDHLLQVDGLSRYQLIDKGLVIEDAVRRIDGVDAVGRTQIGIAPENSNNTSWSVPSIPKPVNMGQYNVDTGFKDAMGLKLIAGRWFDDSREMDDSTLPFPTSNDAEKALAARGANVVINELGAHELGFANAADAVGKTFKAALVQSENGNVPSTIVGVVGDARFRSVKLPLEPIAFQKTRTVHQYLMVRYHGDPAAVRDRVERAWKGFTREVPFDAKFSDDIVQELYKADDARAKTFAAFAVLSVIIGCLGLFGLAAFTAERRTKEIGIRKVLGARTRDIIRLLIWQFSKPVMIANMIAWPVAWWLMRDWLNTFDARISLGVGPFFAAGFAALIIAAGTVAGHAARVARANPIHALRYE